MWIRTACCNVTKQKRIKTDEAMAKTILIVDTNDQGLADLAESLRQHGYNAKMRFTADDPVAQFGILLPQLIILNLEEPPAIEYCEEIRGNPNGVTVPIIFIGTGNERVTSPSEALTHGADYYFQVPLDTAKVVAKAETYLGPGIEPSSPKHSVLGHATTPKKTSAQEPPAPNSLEEDITQPSAESIHATNRAKANRATEKVQSKRPTALFGDFPEDTDAVGRSKPDRKTRTQDLMDGFPKLPNLPEFSGSNKADTADLELSTASDTLMAEIHDAELRENARVDQFAEKMAKGESPLESQQGRSKQARTTEEIPDDKQKATSKAKTAASASVGSEIREQETYPREDQTTDAEQTAALDQDETYKQEEAKREEDKARKEKEEERERAAALRKQAEKDAKMRIELEMRREQQEKEALAEQALGQEQDLATDETEFDQAQEERDLRRKLKAELREKQGAAETETPNQAGEEIEYRKQLEIELRRKAEMEIRAKIEEEMRQKIEQETQRRMDAEIEAHKQALQRNMEKELRSRLGSKHEQQQDMRSPRKITRRKSENFDEQIPNGWSSNQRLGKRKNAEANMEAFGEHALGDADSGDDGEQDLDMIAADLFAKKQHQISSKSRFATKRRNQDRRGVSAREFDVPAYADRDTDGFDSDKLASTDLSPHGQEPHLKPKQDELIGQQQEEASLSAGMRGKEAANVGTDARRIVFVEHKTGFFSRTHDLAGILFQFYRQRMTGRLNVESENRKKSIFFELGQPVDAYSSQVFDRIEEYLYREGKITRAQYQDVRVKGIKHPRKICTYLVSEGHLKPQELFASVRGHLKDVVYGLFEWEQGTYVYAEELVDEDDRVALDVDMRFLIVEGIRRKYLMPRLLTLIGSPSSLLAFRAGVEPMDAATADALGLQPKERRLAKLIDGTRSVEDLVFSTGLAVEQVFQLLAALLAMDILEIRVRGIEGFDEDGQVGAGESIDRERIEEKLEQVRKLNYFQILGVAATATAYEVDRAYERAMFEFDPSHFSSGIQNELSEELREIGNVLEEARLVLRDDKLRVSYARNVL